MTLPLTAHFAALLEHTDPMHTGRISSKHQLTLPAELVRALHLRTGDTLEFRLTPHHTLELLPLRPDFEIALEQFLQGVHSNEEVRAIGQTLESTSDMPSQVSHD